MPELEPEGMSLVSMQLFLELTRLARVAYSTMDMQYLEEEVTSQLFVSGFELALQINGVSQLWDIALRSQNTDVSILAINHVNDYYINYNKGVLDKEGEFVDRVMEALELASSKLEQARLFYGFYRYICTIHY